MGSNPPKAVERAISRYSAHSAGAIRPKLGARGRRHPSQSLPDIFRILLPKNATTTSGHETNVRVPLEVVQRNYEMRTKRKGKLVSGQTETRNAPGHERQVGDYDFKVGHGGLCQGNHPASATGICTRLIDEGTS